MNKILLVDIDGTLTMPLSGGSFGKHPRDYQIIEGAAKAIAHYVDQGYKVAACTNQAGVAAGHKSLAECVDEQRYKLDLFPEIIGIYFCPDYEGNHCWLVPRNHSEKAIHIAWAKDLVGSFRKPGAGMLQAAIRNHGQADSLVLYVGDSAEADEGAAKAANVPFMWAKDWWIN